MALAGSRTRISPDASNKTSNTSVVSAAPDPDLAQVIAAWPNLPESTKQEILALAKTQAAK